MKHLQTRGVIRELALKHGISIKQLENIVGIFSEFIQLKIKEDVDKVNGKYPVFYVKGLGTFHVKDSVKEAVMRAYKRKQEQQDESIPIQQE